MEINALEDLLILIKQNKSLPKQLQDWAESLCKTAYTIGRMDGVNELKLMMTRFNGDCPKN